MNTRPETARAAVARSSRGPTRKPGDHHAATPSDQTEPCRPAVIRKDTAPPMNATTGEVRLRPYQAEAVDAVAAGLRGGGRGQLHAACGSGKTLMAITAAGRVLPGDGLVVVLCAVPGAGGSVHRDWRLFSHADAVLAVCSDESVTDSAVHTADLTGDVTTDPGEIRAWLGLHRTGRRLVVSTYISAHRLAEALAGSGQTADFALFDEAHHLAGRPDFLTRRVLEDAFLPCRRRLYMTATPRIDDARAESVGALSMDDTQVFGPVLYSYPWSRAIREGYLDDYRIVVMGVTESQVQDLLTDDQHAYADQPGGIDLRVMAAQAIIAKAAAKYDLRRIIAFCHRLDLAREFAATMSSTVRRLPPGQRPEAPLHAERISGPPKADGSRSASRTRRSPSRKRTPMACCWARARYSSTAWPGSIPARPACGPLAPGPRRTPALPPSGMDTILVSRDPFSRLCRARLLWWGRIEAAPAAPFPP